MHFMREEEFELVLNRENIPYATSGIESLEHAFRPLDSLETSVKSFTREVISMGKGR